MHAQNTFDLEMLELVMVRPVYMTAGAYTADKSSC